MGFRFPRAIGQRLDALACSLTWKKRGRPGQPGKLRGGGQGTRARVTCDSVDCECQRRTFSAALY